MAIKQLVNSDSTMLTLNPRDFFVELVEDGFSRRNFRPPSAAQNYLVDILEHYIDARNLFVEEIDEQGVRKDPTLAESYLRAMDKNSPDRFEMLKRLGDSTLYISGIFGDSLNRKLVDIDYYAGLGGAAYGNLSDLVSEVELASVYKVFSKNFLEFVDVLTYISQRAFIQNDEGILRLYDRYLKTGSQLARERLLEFGVIPLSPDQIKNTRQD